MKISGLKISGYKNLKNLEMDFEKDVSLIALIGDNGSGKSNVLEALTIIFSRLSMKEKISFDKAFVETVSDKFEFVEGSSL